MSGHGLTPAQIRQRVRESRLAQGLPERIEDAYILRTIAALLTATAHGINRAQGRTTAA